MEYSQIIPGRFLSRPNRFIAQVEIQHKGELTEETVHVKNTGRCRELLVPGARVYLAKSENPARKTAWDLVAVQKGDLLINMDSAAPNRAVLEWLRAGRYLKGLTKIRPETVYGNSRFDFYAEAGERKILIEVKGVTLEHQRTALFPDAPSERAVRHADELAQAAREGYECYVLFVIQMKGVRRFLPNWKMHPAFGEALLRAEKAGVKVLAWDCRVEAEGMELADPVPVFLEPNPLLLLDTPSSDIAEPLLVWYDENRRVLPWREEPSPYRIWVSEIMLQQTRVEAVKPYFSRFMDRLPDIASLAEADEDTLLKLWEGLGYYSRARNLHRAAVQIMEEYGGRMPGDYAALQKLSGIGSYTAGAIASIAFGQPVPAVDGNVLRVIARLTEDRGDIADPSVKRKLERNLLPVMPKDRPGDFNQALMELGATVCLPNGAPLCDRCPWQSICLARRDGVQEQYPKKSAKKARRIEKKTVLLIRDSRCVAIRKRPAGGLLAGLYEFPCLDGHLTKKEVLAWMNEHGVRAVRIEKQPDSRHIFTHREWEMIGYMALVDELEPLGRGEGLLFARPEEIGEKYPIPSAFAAYTACLNIRTGKNRMEKGEMGGLSK